MERNLDEMKRRLKQGLWKKAATAPPPVDAAGMPTAVPAPMPAPGAPAPMPGVDPAAMAAGSEMLGMPPSGDPNAMMGAMPPGMPPADSAMMGGMPPADPALMAGGMPPGIDPNAMPPEVMPGPMPPMPGDAPPLEGEYPPLETDGEEARGEEDALEMQRKILIAVEGNAERLSALEERFDGLAEFDLDEDMRDVPDLPAPDEDTMNALDFNPRAAEAEPAEDKIKGRVGMGRLIFGGLFGKGSDK